MPKLKNLFINRGYSSLCPFLISNRDLLPNLQVLGCSIGEGVLTLAQLRPVLDTVPHLRLLSYEKDTLWSVATMLTNFYDAFEALRALQGHFPGQVSFDINAVNPETGKTAVYHAFVLRTDGSLNVKLVSSLLEMGADPHQRIGRVSASRASPQSPRLISLILGSMLKDDNSCAELLWQKHSEKYGPDPARRWIDEEPLHPLVIAFAMSSSNMLLKLMKTWKWDYFLPADEPLVSKDYVSLPHAAPLILSCFHTATVQCMHGFMDHMKGDAQFMEQLLVTLHSPSLSPQGGCWLLWMASACVEVLDVLLQIPGVDKSVTDKEGFGLFHHCLLSWQLLPPSLDFDTTMFLEAMESSSKAPVITCLQTRLSSDPPAGIPSFVLPLQRGLMSCKHGMSLFDFLKTYHFRIHSKYLSFLLRALPDTPTDLRSLSKLPAILTPSELDILAGLVASKPDLYDYSVRLTLQALKDAGALWLDTQEFVDLVWSTWTREQLEQSQVLSITTYLPLPTTGTVNLLDLVCCISWQQRGGAVLVAMQRLGGNNIDQDSWYPAFQEMFPPGFSNVGYVFRNMEGRVLNAIDRRVFTKFIVSLEFKDPHDLLKHIVDAINNEVDPAALKKVLSSNQLGEAKEAASKQFWQAVFKLQGVLQDAYASRVADMLIELEMKTPENPGLKFHVGAFPTAVRKYISFHGF
jgi:hypothetical protein